MFTLNLFNSIFSFHFGIKIAFYRIDFLKIKIIVILNVKYMFKKVKKLELRGRICAVVATERLERMDI